MQKKRDETKNLSVETSEKVVKNYITDKKSNWKYGAIKKNELVATSVKDRAPINAEGKKHWKWGQKMAKKHIHEMILKNRGLEKLKEGQFLK